jgi:uncharacterized membrane protein
MKTTLNKVLVRISNPKVIVALVSGVLAILINTGGIAVENANHVIDIINTVLGLAVTVGVFGNPESHIPDAISPVVEGANAHYVPEPEVFTVPYFDGSVVPAPVEAPVQP